MRPIQFTFTPAAADDDLIAASQTPGGAGKLTLVSSTVTLDVARPVVLTVASDESGKTFTVTGTDRNGAPQSESFAGPASGTQESAKAYKTITAISVSAGTAGAVKFGTGDTIWTAWIPVDTYLSANFSVKAIIPDGASMTVDGYSTLDNVLAEGFREEAANEDAITDLANKTDTALAHLATPITALRFKISDYESGSLTVQVLQEAEVY